MQTAGEMRKGLAPGPSGYRPDYLLMYLTLCREEFWDIEMGIVMLVSFLPGIGLYWLLTRKPSKQAGAAKDLPKGAA